MDYSEDRTPDTNQPVSTHVSKKKIIIIAIIIDVIVMALVAYYFLSSSGETNIKNITSKVTEKVTDKTPTPYPFQEMTIPYLRVKTFNSQLSDLEEYSDNSNYTSFLTSYQSDGFRINGLLTRPKGEMPDGGWPAIVFVHGYIPPAQYSTTGEAYSTYVDYLARNGFVVFKIDLRGHGNSEGEAGGGYFGSDYITDTLNAYDALGSSNFVNPEKIGLWGHSMAGNILLRSVAAKPEIPAVSIWAGAVFSYTDREKYGISDASFQMSSLSPSRQSRRRQLIEKYGEPTNDSPFWKMVIPTNYLGDLKGAVQLNHAKDDTVVDVGYSRDLNSLLDKTQVPHEFWEYESGGHDIEGASFNQAMSRTVEFFRKYLSQ
jgi:uncharacterized protein